MDDTVLEVLTTILLRKSLSLKVVPSVKVVLVLLVTVIPVKELTLT